MQNYILRLDISMNNIVIMHKFDCMTDLLYDIFDLLLNKISLFFHVIIDIPITAKLHHQIEVLFITKS